MLEIIAEILRKADSGATKTKLQRRTGLTTNRMNNHVLLLTERNLLEYRPFSREYKTTQTGYQYLQTYEEMKTLNGILEVLKKRDLKA